MADFSIINYLSGLTGFVFDKTVLERIALENGVIECTSFADLTTEDRDKCKIALLETVLNSPNTMAGSQQQHGNYTSSVTQQIISASVREDIKSQLRVLYKKYQMEDELNAIDGSLIEWVNENSLDY